MTNRLVPSGTVVRTDRYAAESHIGSMVILTVRRVAHRLPGGGPQAAMQQGTAVLHRSRVTCRVCRQPDLNPGIVANQHLRYVEWLRGGCITPASR